MITLGVDENGQTGKLDSASRQAFNMKTKSIRTILCSLFPLIFAAEPATHEADLRLPETDLLWKAVKDYVEVQPVPEYQHASEEARETFRDLKYGARIHWGLYSIKEWKEGWLCHSLAGLSSGSEVAHGR